MTWARGPGLAIALFLVVVVVGTAGYVMIEGWNGWDAFYMTIITVTTVGYREVHPMSRLGELWTAIVLLGGVATLFYTASTVMALVVEGGCTRTWPSAGSDACWTRFRIISSSVGMDGQHHCRGVL